MVATTVSILCAPVLAGTFNISLSMTTHFTPKHLDVEVEVINNGSTTAYGANLILNALANSYAHENVFDILPGTSSGFSFKIPHGKLMHGNYPVVAVCRFKDARDYPFTALHASTFTVDSSCAQLITADLGGISIKKKASVALRLQSPDNLALSATIQLVLPAEFSAIKERRIALPPHSSQPLKFDIFNLHALAGATYPFFCIIQYNKEGCHQTLIVNNTIRVEKISTDSLFYPVRWYLLLGFGIILTGIILTGTIRTVMQKNR